MTDAHSNPDAISGKLCKYDRGTCRRCGPPIEPEPGRLVTTHGISPTGKYCLGAALPALDAPTKVLGRLRTPLLSPEGNEREGYVPNVVHSCGSLLPGRELILPSAMSDKASAIATVSLDDLLAALRVAT